MKGGKNITKISLYKCFLFILGEHFEVNDNMKYIIAERGLTFQCVYYNVQFP